LRIKFKNFLWIFLAVAAYDISSNFVLKANIKDYDQSKNSGYIYKKINSQYILGKGDGLFVRVSEIARELNSTAFVDGDGNIYLPAIGKIYVEGLTLEELASELNIAYKKYVKETKVEITITKYRPIRIFVDGEVANPGLYVLKGSITLDNEKTFNLASDVNTLVNREELLENKEITKNINSFFPTISDALRSGGGLTEFSDISKIKVIRNNSISNGGGKISTILDFNDLFKTGNSQQNIRIYDGDKINVSKSDNPDKNTIINAVKSNLNPKFIRVFVTGKVNNPGSKLIVKASTLNDAIDISGGVKALRGSIKYLSNSNSGSVNARSIRYRKNASRGSINNPYLKDGDLIFVGTSIFSNAASAINEITSPFQGIYSTYRLIELINE